MRPTRCRKWGVLAGLGEQPIEGDSHTAFAERTTEAPSRRLGIVRPACAGELYGEGLYFRLIRELDKENYICVESE